MQQTFVNGFLALGRFEPGRAFEPWILSIARNLVRQELRRRVREDRRLRAYWTALLRCRGSNGTDLESARDEELMEALEQCRRLLSKEAIRALELRYTRSFDLEAIAGELGRTLEAARQLLWRTRVKLRQCIERRIGT